MLLKNLRFQAKICLVAGALALVALLGTAFLAYGQIATQARYQTFIKVDDRGTLLLARATDKMNALLYASHRMAEEAGTPALDGTISRFHGDVDGLLALFNEAQHLDAQLSEALPPFAARFETLRHMMDNVATAAQHNDAAQTRSLLHDVDVDGIALAVDIGALENVRMTHTQQQAAELAKSVTASLIWCIVSVVIAIAVGLAGALFVGTRGMVRPLQEVRERMLGIAKGELDGAVPCADRHDEVGGMAQALQTILSSLTRARASEEEAARGAALERRAVESVREGLAAVAEGNLIYRIEENFPERLQVMRTDFNAAMAKLQQTFGAVHGAVAAISAGAGEISGASTDMSRRTEQQAASIEESSVALSRVAGMLRESADSAAKAAGVTESARQGAEKSGAIVHAAVGAMGHIETSFTQIAQVIGLIDDIAFQTNLLALNAGIEAARAGEAGRGFAVVATEVRTLAQRSAEGARQVKELVTKSGDYVTDGVHQVRDAGAALEVILGHVGQINSLVSDIAQASAGQSTAVEEINIAVGEMTKTTQQNAAMVEQSAAAIASLNTEAGALQTRIAFFQVGAEPAEPAPRPAASPRFTAPARRTAEPARALVSASDDAGWADFM